MAEIDELSGLTVLKTEAEHGRLPFDHFLIAWWDHTTFSSVFSLFDKLPEEIRQAIQDLNTQSQLSKLQHVYIDSGWDLRRHYFPDRRSRSRSPSPTPQIPSPLSAIIPSLNTIQERNLIHESANRGGSCVLRTCYRPNPADEARHQWLLDEYAEWSTPPETFLNDGSRYSFGADYERIFELMPDLLSGRAPYTAEERVKNYIELLEDSPPGSPISGVRIARDNIVNWIQIEDEAFFDGEPVLLVYHDEYGKTCVSRRDDMTPALQFGAWFNGCWRDALDFEGGEGKDYVEDGKRTAEWQKRVQAEMARSGRDQEVERRWEATREERESKGGRKRQYANKRMP